MSSLHRLLLTLMNFLADFDGELSDEALASLEELKARSHDIPPLYADVFSLPHSATCADLVSRIMALSQEQIAIASYAFQIFRYYEQILRATSYKEGMVRRSAQNAAEVQCQYHFHAHSVAITCPN